MADDNTNSSSDGSCRLLALPAELRNRIYEYVLLEAEPVRPFKIMNKPFRAREPPLARTNQQLRAECLPVFYGANTFALEYPGYAMEFLDKLGPKRRHMLRRVYIDGDDYQRKTSRSWLAVVKACLHAAHKRFGGDEEHDLRTSVVQMPLPVGDRCRTCRIDCRCTIERVDLQTVKDYRVVELATYANSSIIVK